MSRIGGARPLRIAILGDPNSVHTRRWAGYFADGGHEIHVLVPEKDSITVAHDPRYEVNAFSAWKEGRIPGAGLLATSRALGRLLAQIKPDVLHSHSVTRFGLAAWESRFRPYAITVWGSDVLVEPGLSRRRRFHAWLALRGADLVTGGSQHLVRAAVAGGARPSRTRYVPWGVDIDRFSPGDIPAEMRAGLGLPGARVVLSARAIAPIYRQDVVMEAFARLPEQTLLVMTRHGAREADVADLTARAQALGVADRLRILPELPESKVPELYRLADVVVSVPVSDGGPNTVVEALASGRPVVASDLPPNREWLTELDPGSLVPVGDVGATAAAMAAVLARPDDERRARAARGRQAVCERADRRVSMALMETLYQELAARRRAR